MTGKRKSAEQDTPAEGSLKKAKATTGSPAGAPEVQASDAGFPIADPAAGPAVAAAAADVESSTTKTLATQPPTRSSGRLRPGGIGSALLQQLDANGRASVEQTFGRRPLRKTPVASQEDQGSDVEEAEEEPTAAAGPSAALQAQAAPGGGPSDPDDESPDSGSGDAEPRGAGDDSTLPLEGDPLDPDTTLPTMFDDSALDVGEQANKVSTAPGMEVADAPGMEVADAPEAAADTPAVPEDDAGADEVEAPVPRKGSATTRPAAANKTTAGPSKTTGAKAAYKGKKAKRNKKGGSESEDVAWRSDDTEDIYHYYLDVADRTAANVDLANDMPVGPYLKIKNTNYGRVLVTTQSIAAGTLLLQEEAIVTELRPKRTFTGENAEVEYREYLRKHINQSLDKEKARKFLSLCFDGTNDTEESRVKCNAFEIANMENVWYLTSIINHSCLPNAYVYQYNGDIGYNLRAWVDIPTPGTEITINYKPDWEAADNRKVKKPPQMTNPRRREIQQQWGFECQCPLCQNWLETDTINALLARYEQELDTTGKEIDDLQFRQLIMEFGLSYVGLLEAHRYFTSLHDVLIDLANYLGRCADAGGNGHAIARHWQVKWLRKASDIKFVLHGFETVGDGRHEAEEETGNSRSKGKGKAILPSDLFLKERNGKASKESKEILALLREAIPAAMKKRIEQPVGPEDIPE